MSDRTVHAEHDGQQIVRYDRAGKWYVEQENAGLVAARRIAVNTAARLAASWPDHAVRLGLPGGRTFDLRVQAERRKQGATRP